MKKIDANIEKLKAALENIHKPENLDTHSWVTSLFVQDAIANHPNLKDRTPGEQVLFALAELFRTMMPVLPPKRGVRLDARWSEFGFLAAKYFSPILFGTPVPASFQEAWGRIDQSILLFVFGKPASELTTEEIEAYVLIGNEPEVTPVSTISDWHRKGLYRLMNVIATRESYLSIAGIKNAEALSDSTEKVDQAQQRRGSRKKNRSATSFRKQKQIRFIWFLTVFAVILFLGLKGWSIYRSSQVVLDDVNQLREKVELPPSLDDIDVAIPILEQMKKDVDKLQSDSAPVIWSAPLFRWVPNYGCDIAASGSLLKIGDGLLDVILDTYHTGQPVLEAMRLGDRGLTPTEITKMFVKAQPQFADSLNSLESIRNVRGQIDVSCLSPDTQDLVTNKVDPLLNALNDALTLAVEIPNIAGADREGPKTYLLLVQNEDELRPTGGFITAASTVLIRDGKVVKYNFENSGDLDNWDMPYPTPPWQLRQYMNSRVLIFRDTNWFVDFPTAALYAETLYAYKREHSVDGVVAFDQHVLVELLGAMGPVNISDASQPIDASNVIPYMRAAKTRPANASESSTWTNKDFINKLFAALMNKMAVGDVQWEKLIPVLVRTLNEHHILIQLDNDVLSSYLARYAWDGEIRPGMGDFLMVVDSNVGFNKTNAVIDTSISYSVDLTHIDSPIGQLKVSHTNNSDGHIPCVQWHGFTAIGEDEYPIHRCYWDYLRVYTKSGTHFLRGNAQFIPGDWMILKRNVLPKVDVLAEEIEDVQGFGVLKVVPGGRTITSEFQFALPSNVVQHQPRTNRLIYQLRVQKQPGTIAVPFEFSLHLPGDVVITSMPEGALIKSGAVFMAADLDLDRVFTFEFRPK